MQPTQPDDSHPDEGTLIVPHTPEDPPSDTPAQGAGSTIKPDAPTVPSSANLPTTGGPAVPESSVPDSVGQGSDSSFGRDHVLTPSPGLSAPEDPAKPPEDFASQLPTLSAAPASSEIPAPTPSPAQGQVVSGGFGPSVGTPGVVVGATDPAAALSPPPSSKRRILKPLLLALAVILLIGGGSAAAYFGVVVPNKPANVLKTALLNTIQQKQVSSSGNFSASADGIAYKGSFSTAADTAAKSLDGKFNLTVSGVNFSVESRLVNQNLYIKVGDLSTIAGLVDSFVPSSGATIQSLSGDLSNKWIVVDSTLIDESGSAKCLLNSSWSLTPADIKLLESQYTKHPFVAIQSSSSSTVGGQPAEKFALNISNATLNDFGNGVTGLSLFKSLAKCSGSSPTSTPSTNHGSTPLTVWVDKGTKRIVQIGIASKDAKTGVSGSGVVTLHYGKVSITAPANAEPALQVLTDIENSAKNDPTLQSLLNTGDSSGSSSSLLSGGTPALTQ